jgi:hypothetical protein
LICWRAYEKKKISRAGKGRASFLDIPDEARLLPQQEKVGRREARREIIWGSEEGSTSSAQGLIRLHPAIFDQQASVEKVQNPVVMGGNDNADSWTGGTSFPPPGFFLALVEE